MERLGFFRGRCTDIYRLGRGRLGIAAACWHKDERELRRASGEAAHCRQLAEQSTRFPPADLFDRGLHRRKTMRVARTLSRAKEGPRFSTPKTSKGRSIALTQRAIEALKSHRKRQLEEQLGATDYEDSGLVFCSPAGRPLSRERVDRGSLQPILKRAGLVSPDGHRITPHDLRHTCATLLLSQNVHPKYVQVLLGHAKIAMTLDRYSHWIPSMGNHTARAMEAALG